MINNQTDMETRLNELEKELALLQSRSCIENLMGTYQQMVSCGELPLIPERLFAKEPEDSCIEYGAAGPYKGFKKLSTFYEKDILPGRFSIAAMGSSIITIDEDGDSARGIWTVLGTEVDSGDLGPAPAVDPDARRLLSMRTPEGQCYRVEWVWQRYDVRFVKESGSWKIWQLHIYELMRSPFDRDFVKYASERWATDGIRLDLFFTSNIPFAPGELPENLASGATTGHWQYTPDAMPPKFE